MFTTIQKILIEQIKIIKSQSKVQRFSFTPAQRETFAELLFKINFNIHYCFAFKKDTVKDWAKQYIHNKPPKHQINVIKSNKITEYEKQMFIKIHFANLSYGWAKIHGQLKNLNIKMCVTSVANIIKKYYKDNPPKSTGKWKQYLNAIIDSLFACDYKVIIDKHGNKIFVLFFMNIFNRKIVHYNITKSRTKNWQENQLRELTDGSSKKRLITDNDIVFNEVDFDMFNIKRIKIKPYCPKMNAFVERFIGSFNREALVYYHKDELTIKNIQKIVKDYVHFYNNYRNHQSIGNITIPQFENKDNIENADFNIHKVKRKTFLDCKHSYYYLKNCA
jgi:transposase InsO family protein